MWHTIMCIVLLFLIILYPDTVPVQIIFQCLKLNCLIAHIECEFSDCRVTDVWKCILLPLSQSSYWNKKKPLISILFLHGISHGVIYGRVDTHRRFKGVLWLWLQPDEKPLYTARPSSLNSPQTGTDRLLVVIDMTPAEPGFKLLKTDVADQK